MTNSKAVREQLLKQAGATKLENGKWLIWQRKRPNVCFTCKSCWRRSLQSDLARLQCPFCGGNMQEARQ